MKEIKKIKKIKSSVSEIEPGTVVYDNERKGMVIKVDHNNEKILVDWVTNGSKFTSWKTIDNLEFK